MKNLDQQFIDALRIAGKIILGWSTAEVVNVYFNAPFNSFTTGECRNMVCSWNRVSSLVTGGLYHVGGSVRDSIMGLPVSDHDYVVIGQTPESMIQMGFEQVGADFPVFLHPETKEEYALARTEQKTGTGYHGFAVDFDSSVTLVEDLRRRDLTMNAIARDVITDEIIDPFGGVEDIKNKVIRCVDKDTFMEDPLRVLRAIRFAGRYPDMYIEPDTMIAINTVVEKRMMEELPDERFVAELKKCYNDFNNDFVKIGRFLHYLEVTGVAANVGFFKELGGVIFCSFAEMTANSFINLNVYDHFKSGKPKGVSDADVLLSVTLAANASYGAFTTGEDMGGEIIKRFFSMESAAAKFLFHTLHDSASFVKGVIGYQEYAERLTRAIVSSRLTQLPDNKDLLWYLDVIITTAAKTTGLKPLSETVNLMAQVKAEQFPNLHGRELGDAIFKKRVEILIGYSFLFPDGAK